jgi:hypothetical protein
MPNILPLTVVLSLLPVAPAPAGQAPTIEEVLARAAVYTEQYHRTFAVAVADEKADLIMRGFGVQSSDLPGAEAVAGQTKVSLMKGTVAVVAAERTKGWLCFRDVMQVNNKVVHDRKDRLERLFVDSPSTAVAEARRIHAESVRWDVGSVARALIVPTMPLMFLFKQNQSAFSFRKGGEKKAGNERVWVVDYEETRHPTLMTTSEGEDYPIHGKFWIEPASGRVVRTQMIVENLKPATGTMTDSERYRPRITLETIYQADPKLNLWVPAQLKELYDKQAERTTGETTYTNFRLLQVDAAQIVPKK